jgi:hypothetical protein
MDDVNIARYGMPRRSISGYHHGDSGRWRRGANASGRVDDASRYARWRGGPGRIQLQPIKDRAALSRDCCRDHATCRYPATALGGPPTGAPKQRDGNTDYALSHPHRYRLVNRHDIRPVQQRWRMPSRRSSMSYRRRSNCRGVHACRRVWSLVHGYVSLTDVTLVAGGRSHRRPQSWHSSMLTTA